jgi:hypothetical protein
MPDENKSETMVDDPLVTHSLHEAKWIFVVWAVSFLWVVGYCGRYGYFREDETITMVLGMPAWVFWGVALPWVIATGISSWFALRLIADEPLTRASDPEQLDDE